MQVCRRQRNIQFMVMRVQIKYKEFQRIFLFDLLIFPVYVFVHHNKRCKLMRIGANLFQQRNIHSNIHIEDKITYPELCPRYKAYDISAQNEMFVIYTAIQIQIQYLQRRAKSPIMSKNFLAKKYIQENRKQDEITYPELCPR